ncbi:hypothetical protein KP509_22G066400 [Ceratopteris richardii]|uniref:Cyclin-dependent kinase inhibitor domain-containing protein n=1 Tax=Ceratopteris richardii TaxID=49495 RepID=A0A8T2S744_CERRI|nr:hypothetical protein KP509_22G066400 [Ceratopteris richardii]
MGKYMRKGKGVGKIAAIEEALGVRTRARALALQRDSSRQVTPRAHEPIEAPKQLDSCARMECCMPPLAFEGSRTNTHCETDYMELRNRRFEKIYSKTGQEVRVESDSVACEHVSGSSKTAESLKASESVGASIHRGVREALSRQVSLQSSAAVDAGGDMRRRVTPTASTSNSVSMSARKPTGILTRHQRQALASLLSTESMEIEAELEPSSRANLELNGEQGEQFFGESHMVAGPHKDRHRRRTRESTPDSYAWSMEAPGSTSRTRRGGRNQCRSLSAPPFNRGNEAPSTSEIEAFFQGAEQQERRRFIERYNFDPVSERPLRGRYEWTNT